MDNKKFQFKKQQQQQQNVIIIFNTIAAVLYQNSVFVQHKKQLNLKFGFKSCSTLIGAHKTCDLSKPATSNRWRQVGQKQCMNTYA